LMIGRLDENKRVGVFLEALVAARKIEPDLRGVIVGEGDLLDDLRRRAQHLGLPSPAVEFPGKLPDVSDYYAEADVFVHLAASEGTPNVVLEAMAAGLPVITTEAGDLRRIVRHRQTGLIVPVDDAQAVAESLLELARSPESASRLGEQARAEVLETYSARNVRSALEHFYSEIHSRRRR
jgi:glycosyltransferase involved in cell wall biosynthesis